MSASSSVAMFQVPNVLSLTNVTSPTPSTWCARAIEVWLAAAKKKDSGRVYIVGL